MESAIHNTFHSVFKSICPSVTAIDHKIFTYIIYHLLELIILLSYGLTLKSTPTNQVKLVTVDQVCDLAIPANA